MHFKQLHNMSTFNPITVTEMKERLLALPWQGIKSLNQETHFLSQTLIFVQPP